MEWETDKEATGGGLNFINNRGQIKRRCRPGNQEKETKIFVSSSWRYPRLTTTKIEKVPWNKLKRKPGTNSIIYASTLLLITSISFFGKAKKYEMNIINKKRKSLQIVCSLALLGLKKKIIKGIQVGREPWIALGRLLTKCSLLFSFNRKKKLRSFFKGKVQACLSYFREKNINPSIY